MSTTPHSDDLHNDQAAFWAAKLDGGTLTSKERVQLEAWLAADPLNRALLTEYCQFSADLEEQLPPLVAAGSVAMPVSSTPKRTCIRSIAWFGSALAAAAAVALGVWLTFPSHRTETLATSVAERKSLRLSDGSRLELNARTNVLVSMSSRERHVRMADGQALFNVTKDPSRPFVVETPAGAIRVTGTVFDVQSDSATQITVSVVEGSVQVSPGGSLGTVSLKAREQVIVRDGAMETKTLDADSLEDALAWREGYIVFDATPLSQATARFARYHGRSVRTDGSASQLRVSGRYSLDDLDAFLAAIEAALPVQITRELNGAISVAVRNGE